MNRQVLVWCLILVSILIPPTNNSQPADTGYQGLIKETDIRLSQVRQLIIENKPLPEFLILRYQGKELNHVVFYDLDGKQALYKYRTDRFDDLSEKKVKQLRPGQAYRVRGRFVGLLEEQLVQLPGQDRYQELVSSNQGRLAFEFESAELIQTDFIFY
ncbi:MAG: hypothetical protein H3C43_07040 [Leptonema sp. (in: Bacteria)]|nr:hypothetical protein [Leptonema sp. (in: bacteria)]